MATVYTVTHDFDVDTFAVADYVDANFTDILTAINALDAGNLASGTVALARISGLTSTQCAAAFFKDEDDMASDSATAVSSQQAIKAHVAAAVPDDDAFGAWASKSDSTTYQAASDGFVCAIGPSPSGAVTGITDSNAAPTTIRAYQNGASAVKVSIMLPVKKSDYWKVTGSVTVYWLPVGA